MDSDYFLQVLGEEYSPEILAATRSPKSAKELSKELDVPIATCYRRIEALVDAGLLRQEGRQLSNHGRRTSVYRRTVDELLVSFEEDEASISVTERTEAKNNLHDVRPSLER